MDSYAGYPARHFKALGHVEAADSPGGCARARQPWSALSVAIRRAMPAGLTGSIAGGAVAAGEKAADRMHRRQQRRVRGAKVNSIDCDVRSAKPARIATESWAR